MQVACKNNVWQDSICHQGNPMWDYTVLMSDLKSIDISLILKPLHVLVILPVYLILNKLKQIFIWLQNILTYFCSDFIGYHFTIWALCKYIYQHQVMTVLNCLKSRKFTKIRYVLWIPTKVFSNNSHNKHFNWYRYSSL